MRKSRNKNVKLATCPMFSTRAEVTPAALAQVISAVIGVRHRGFLVSPGDCFVAGLARNSRHAGKCEDANDTEKRIHMLSENLSPAVPVHL